MGLYVVNRGRLGRAAALGVLLAAACTDDGVAMTDSAGGTESSSGTTDNPTTVTTITTTPTTTDPTTTDPTVPTTTDTATDTATTSPVTTTDTTTGTTDTSTGTTDTTDTTTDTTTGDPVAGKSVSQTVNGGTVASSPGFRMVFTIGQPTQNQGVYTSANFRLQGGLIGANGNPP